MLSFNSITEFFKSTSVNYPILSGNSTMEFNKATDVKIPPYFRGIALEINPDLDPGHDCWVLNAFCQLEYSNVSQSM